MNSERIRYPFKRAHTEAAPRVRVITLAWPVSATLVCVVMVAFPYGWCSQSLLYEMGAELMYPLPECFVAGYMTLLNNLFVDFAYGVLYFFPRFGNIARQRRKNPIV